MRERTKLLKISQSAQAFEDFITHLDDIYKSILVLIVEQSVKKFTIYLVKEKPYDYVNSTIPYSERILNSSCFKALENVVDYKYDDSKQILLLNVETSDELGTGYWTAFSANNVALFHLEKDFSFDTFLKVKYFNKEVPNAFFREDFSYLPTGRVVNIDGTNYLINFSSWNELKDIKPLYYDRFLEIGSAGTTLYSSFDELKTLFGPFSSIVPFEDGEYPVYKEQLSHGYLGKDENNNIIGMFITRDDSSFDAIHYSNYDYRKIFDTPLKSLKFFKRDLEKNDQYNKRYCARDIWKLTYPDGSKAVMFKTIGERDFAFPTMFHYFIIKESDVKEYFSD